MRSVKYFQGGIQTHFTTHRASPYVKNVYIHFRFVILARRRAAAKRKKLKNLGKSKSTDTEEEDAEDDCGDDGKLLRSSNTRAVLVYWL